MQVFTVIHLQENEIISVTNFRRNDSANEEFEELMQREGLDEWSRERMEGSPPNLLRGASDDVKVAQMYGSEV